MTTLTEEQVESLCDKYCRFPYNVEQTDLDQICEKCPLEEGRTNEHRIIRNDVQL